MRELRYNTLVNLCNGKVSRVRMRGSRKFSVSRLRKEVRLKNEVKFWIMITIENSGIR